MVYPKATFGNPQQTLRYLGRYTHRVAISNQRLIWFDSDRVQFRFRDREAGNLQRTMELSAEEFTRRFLLHVLGKGFVRIRYFGFLANGARRASLALCRRLLNYAAPSLSAAAAVAATHGWTCPDCGAPVQVSERLTAAEIVFRKELRLCPAFDTS